MRFVHAHPAAMFAHLLRRPGHNKRPRAALPLVKQVINALATDTAF
jgi:hypothetical protein